MAKPVQWDPAQYLRHSDDRARPFIELVARIDGDPETVVDLGCGPGHLTPVLQRRWPDAHITGVDSSPEMIETAQTSTDGANYVLADVSTWQPAAPVDVIVSNAMFQWVPDQTHVIETLLEHVRPGGSFALQVPNNGASAAHRLLSEVGEQPRFAEYTRLARRLPELEPEIYVDLFVAAGWSFDVWETTYRHVLPGEDAVWDWISGTGARPWVQSLPEDLAEEFVTDYKAALREAYPRQPWGTLMPFQRTFAIGQRPE